MTASTSGPGLIAHITTRADWQRADQSRCYAPSSVVTEGFIHFSTLDQVVDVANAAFSGTDDLVLVCVRTDGLRAPLRYEAATSGGQRFPHLYGPLNLDAVVHVLPLVEQAGGFVLPDSTWTQPPGRP